MHLQTITSPHAHTDPQCITVAKAVAERNRKKAEAEAEEERLEAAERPDEPREGMAMSRAVNS